MIKEAIVKIVNKGDLSYDEAYRTNKLLVRSTALIALALFLPYVQ